jgi:3',5'-cyclic AMP phosphodiesterase CpdA
MVRIAHLSDVHVLEPKASFDYDVRFVSLARPLDARARIEKLRAAFVAAKRAGADHVVLSGDLTETGTKAQFETFAHALSESGFPTHAVTLVPGNHDAYTKDGWSWALEGPLRPWAAGAAREPGKVIDLGSAYILPIDVSMHQSITRSAGELTNGVADALEARLLDPALSRKPVIFAQHHPPFPHTRVFWQWVDGLRGYARLLELLVRHAHVHLLHGHLHQVVDRFVRKARVFGAPAIVEDERTKPRVRIYELRAGELESIGLVG